MSAGHEEYEYFMNFVHTMANLTLTEFSTLYEFEQDERLMSLNLTELVQFVSNQIYKISYSNLQIQNMNGTPLLLICLYDAWSWAEK